MYGYLLPRCSDPVLAQDLTAATFLAAVGKHPEPLTVAWLIGVARHKLVDHWRRRERKERALRRCPITGPRSRCATSTGCRSARVAAQLQRTVHGTETLLVRARAAFRAAYSAPGACDD